MVNFRPLRDRNFALCCLIIFCAFGVLYGSSTRCLACSQSLFGYDAYHAGLVLSPAGFFTITMHRHRRRSARTGRRRALADRHRLLIVAVGNFWMSHLNLEISPGRLSGRASSRSAASRWSSPRSTWRLTFTCRASCAAPPSACSRCCATKAAASAPRSDRPFWSAASNFTRCA